MSLTSRLALPAICGLLAAATPALAGPTLVVDAATGQVLQQDEATRPWHPASTTKIMTAYVALRAIQAGRIGLETPIPISKLAASQPRVKVYARAGQEITLDAALKVMMVKSANDIAFVVAEGVGGTVENFVGMMNAEARRLGMSATRFTNPNGWHHPAQQTSARDLALLTMTILREFPEYRDYWGIGAVQIGGKVLQNTNGLIGRYAGATGFKTGFVCASGFNVVTTANRGGRQLIAIVMGALSGAERTVRASQLLDEGFGTWSGGYTLSSLPASGYASATNICSEVRRRGGGGALADDADNVGPISAPSYHTAMSDNGLSDRFATPAGGGGGWYGSQQRQATGRLTLGPRASFTPIPLAYGRSAGSASAPIAANARPSGQAPSTMVAGRPSLPGATAVPVAASLAAPVAAGAIAASRTPQPAMTPANAARAQRMAALEAAQRGRAVEDETPEAPAAGRGPAQGRPGGIALPQRAAAFAAPAAGTGSPLKLQQGAATGAQPQPLRPGAAAGIRPQAAPARTTTAPARTATAPASPPAKKPQAAKPTQDASKAKAAQASKAKEKAKPAAQKPATPARPVQAKPKPANDD